MKAKLRVASFVGASLIALGGAVAVGPAASAYSACTGTSTVGQICLHESTNFGAGGEWKKTPTMCYAKGTSFSLGSFRDKAYFAIDRDPNNNWDVYNEISLLPDTRLARVPAGGSIEFKREQADYIKTY